MLSVEEMYGIDKNAQKLGIPALLLMENAGANAARIAHGKFNLEGKNVVIFAGSGNNGGDGLVFARHAHKYGASVSVILAKKPLKTKESKTNYSIIKNMNLPVYDGKIPVTVKQSAGIAVDAMLGIGLKKEVKEPYSKLISTFNSLDCIRISLDCPSGIDADTGKTMGTAVKPDMTITFHDTKKGMNKLNSGIIEIADIGIKRS